RAVTEGEPAAGQRRVVRQGRRRRPVRPRLRHRDGGPGADGGVPVPADLPAGGEVAQGSKRYLAVGLGRSASLFLFFSRPPPQPTGRPQPTAPSPTPRIRRTAVRTAWPPGKSTRPTVWHGRPWHSV